MPQTNYVSPASLLPNQVPMQPPSFLQGMQYNNQNADYADTQALSQLMTRIAAQTQQEELTKGAPVRDAKRLSDIETYRATAANIGMFKQGEARTADAAGRKAQGTLVSDIATKVAEDAVKRGKAGVDQAQTAMKYGILLSRIPGPQGVAQAAQWAKENNVDPKIIEMGMSDPKGMMEFITSVNETIQGKIAEQTSQENLQQTGRMALGKQHDASAERIANTQAAAMRERLDAGMNKMSTNQRLSMYTDEILRLQRANQPVPPELMAMAQSLRQQAIAEKTAGIQQGQAGTTALIPDIPTAAPVQAAPLPGSTPAGPKQLRSLKGKDWLDAAKRANPKASEADLIKYGKSLGVM